MYDIEPDDSQLHASDWFLVITHAVAFFLGATCTGIIILVSTGV